MHFVDTSTNIYKTTSDINKLNNTIFKAVKERNSVLLASFKFLISKFQQKLKYQKTV